MNITISNEITIENPEASLKSWVYDNLRVANPEYTKKVKMGLRLWNTPQMIRLYRTNGNKIILPYGVYHALEGLQSDFEDLAINKVAKVDYGISVACMGLYEYQKKAVAEMLGKRCGILNAPAGSGKTMCGIAMAISHGYKALWVTHTQDLLNQAYTRARMYLPAKKLGKITAGKIDIGECMTFATVQTLCKMDFNKFRDEWDVVIVDEVHRVCGSETKRTQFQTVLSNLNAAYKYGLTATVHRADRMEKMMFSLIGNVGSKISDEEVADKIMQVEIHKWRTGCPFPEGCTDTDGTLIYAQYISALASNPYRNKQIADLVVAETDKKHYTLVLSDRLSHFENIIRLIPESYHKWISQVDGSTPKAIREKALDEVRAGTRKILFASYKLAKEGLDIPRLDRLILATPQKDEAVVIQSVGRIARASEGKETPVCYDFVDAFRMSEKHFQERKKAYKKCKTRIKSEMEL